MRHTAFLYLSATASEKAKGKKYRLAQAFTIYLPNGKPSERLQEAIVHTNEGTLSLRVASSGWILTIPKGWAWDGPSGPTIDTPDNLMPSLVHDAGYTLMSAGMITPSCRSYFDRMFYLLLREEQRAEDPEISSPVVKALWQAWAWVRANYFYLGVRIGGGSHAEYKPGEPVDVG